MEGEPADRPITQEQVEALRQRLAELESALALRTKLSRAVDADGRSLWGLLEASSEAVLVVDASGRLCLANQRAEEMFGLEQAELLGQSMETLVLWPAQDEKQGSPLARIAASERDFAHDRWHFIGQRKDGSAFPGECGMATIKMEGDVAVVCFLSEAAEAEGAAEELQRLKEFNEYIVLAMTEGIVVQDREGLLEFINPSVAELLGYSTEELIGQHWTLIVPSDQHHIVNSADERRKKGAEDRYRLQLQRKDGQRVAVLVSGSPRIEGAEFVGSLAVFTDITALEKADQDLRGSELRFRSVAETAADAIIVANHAEHIVYWNRAAGSVFGYSRDEALGKPLISLVPETATQDLSNLMRAAASGATSLASGRPVELQGLTKDGSEFPMEISLSSWKSGEEASYAAIIRDVTEAREAQKRSLVQNSLAAVGQLAAGIAHDFNNLLGTIILYSEMVARTPNLPLKDVSRLNAIIKQAQRGASLTSQILDFSRRAVMEPHPMDLVPFLKEMERLLRRTLQENIRVKLVYQDQQFLVNADPGRLQQALMNLALNARDAMPSGGELRIVLSRIHLDPGDSGPLSEVPPGDWVRIAISDTGTGIPPEALSHIFEPFFTTKSPGKGTGLGLAQVYGIVKQHEGHIDLKSKEGEGTVFRIHLPALEGREVQEPVPEVAVAEPGSGETILIVEDDQATRQAIAEILESLDYATLSAEDGEEALRILEHRGETVSLVLSDLVMPGVGGVELYQHLREERPTLPMVVMTGYPLGTETRSLLEKESINWLQKPLSLELLSNTLTSILG
ncbi:MAG: PAS domain S-box protein [Anaerolineales bacterium]|jgi:PAS domain S-box-containing protein